VLKFGFFKDLGHPYIYIVYFYIEYNFFIPGIEMYLLDEIYTYLKYFYKSYFRLAKKEEDLEEMPRNSYDALLFLLVRQYLRLFMGRI